MTLTAQYRPYRDEECADGIDGDHLAWPENEPSVQIYERTTETIPYHAYRKKSLIWILTFSAFVGSFGFIIGYFSHNTNYHSDSCIHNNNKVISMKSVREEDSLIRAQLLAQISSENIRNQARKFSKVPHLASSPEDLELAISVQEFFRNNHFDKVVLKNYTALLSLPDTSRPNFVSLIDDTGREVYSSIKSSKEQPQSFFSPYSPRGDVTGEVLFVNYGRPVDYLQLQNLFNTTSHEIFSGKIFLAKQFHLSASEQYKYAVALNASALLLYPDPQHYNPQNVKPFPESIWLPPDGVRNDGIFWNGAGDPETFGLPSNSYAFRNRFNEQMTIPAQPISYETAYEIFKHLDGMNVPSDWKGGLNISYRIGPTMKNNFKVRVQVNNRLVRKTIHNVIGTIRGHDEPDRYVLVGNQRDSMSHGAIDSATGVGTFLEMARVFGQAVSNGWRPRRSILFCSWGAEEFNLVGSTEFVEDTLKILYMRAVAYINVNLVVNGNDTLSVAASPLLYHTIFNATKNVFLPKDPQSLIPGLNKNEFNSIYDKWIVSLPKMRNASTLVFQQTIFNHLQNFGVDEKITEKEFDQDHHAFHREEIDEPGSILKTYLESAFQEVRPHVRPLDMYGSYAPFYAMAGIPVVDICFINIDPADKVPEEENEDFEKISINHLPYPLLHTQYDRIEAVEKFIDPSYKYHVTVAQLLTHITERLANSLFLPFNIFDYAQVLKDFYVKTIHMHDIVAMGSKNEQAFGGLNHHPDTSSAQDGTESRSPIFEPNISLMYIDLKSLESAIKNFTQEAIKFHAKQDKINLNDPMMIRQINDKLLLVERQFLDHRGIPSNNLKRHLILSPPEMASMNFPKEPLFPALLDELDQIMGTIYKEDIEQSLIRLKKHLPILVSSIQAAADSLTFNGDFF